MNDTYSITIKGLFAVALLSNGLIENLDDPKLVSAWEQFEADCMMMGYMIKKDEVEEQVRQFAFQQAHPVVVRQLLQMYWSRKD